MTKYFSQTRLVYGNLILRLITLIYIFKTNHFLGGDSNYYLELAQKISQGQWGGDAGRQPLYGWILFLTQSYQNPWCLKFWLALQSLAIWFSGRYFLKWCQRQQINQPTIYIIALLWFFDPLMFIYSSLLMSDAVFSLIHFFSALALYSLIRSYQSNCQVNGKALLLGVGLAFLILCRAIGVPLVLWTIIILSVSFLVQTALTARRNALRGGLIVLGTTITLLLPQIIYNGKVHHRYRPTLQEDFWIHGVAAAVYFHHQGLDFYQAEAKWWQENKGGAENIGLAYRTIFSHLPTLIKLSAKGVARVLVGHVNPEWGYLFLGEHVVGPGWFKVKESRQQPALSVQGWPATLLWILGLAITFVICVVTYGMILKTFWQNQVWSKLNSTQKIYWIWVSGSILACALLPQIWGDARFRLSLWPLVLILLALANQKPKSLGL